jgi:hypothetical protein
MELRTLVRQRIRSPWVAFAVGEWAPLQSRTRPVLEDAHPVLRRHAECAGTWLSTRILLADANLASILAIVSRSRQSVGLHRGGCPIEEGGPSGRVRFKRLGQEVGGGRDDR